MTDTELLNWLEEFTQRGYCPSIVFDDNGHWAVSFSGVSSLPAGQHYSYINEDEWFKTIREAILNAVEMIKKEEGGGR